MSPIDPREIRTATLSDVGRMRSSNQDSCAELADAAGFRLLVVADGMGGHHGGETASRLAVEAMRGVFERGVSEPSGFLNDAFQAANREILRAAAGDPGLSGMGTTGVALLFTPAGSAWVAHVGDSRAYRLRRGRLEAITADHSWVAEEVRNGRLMPWEAEGHPNRNVLLRSIGVEEGVEVDVAEVDVEPDDRFLLCSDGLWGEVDDTRIAHVLEQEEPEQAARSLVDLANDHGGHDNVTVQLASLPRTPIEAEYAPAGNSPPLERRSQRRRRRERRIAAAAAVVGALLLASVLWFFLGSPREDLHDVAAAPPEEAGFAEAGQDTEASGFAEPEAEASSIEKAEETEADTPVELPGTAGFVEARQDTEPDASVEPPGEGIAVEGGTR